MSSSLRENEDQPGLTDYEASFLRLLDKLCNGTRVDINHTGTVVKYKPGLLIGGKVTHDCPPSRASENKCTPAFLECARGHWWGCSFHLETRTITIFFPRRRSYVLFMLTSAHYMIVSHFLSTGNWIFFRSNYMYGTFR